MDESQPVTERPELMRVEEQIILLIQRTKQLWRTSASAVHPDLQPVGYRLLVHLVKHGTVNPGRLADHFESDKSVISRQVRILADLGLVSVEPDPADGRGRLLSATPAACEVVAQTRQRALASLAGGLSSLGMEDLERFAELLELVNEGLERR